MFWSKNKIIKNIFFSIILLLGMFLLFKTNVFAQDAFGLNRIGGSLDLPATDIRLIIAQIIRAILGLLGIIALGLMLYGGFVYMTSAGNEEKVGQARKILINAAIGIMIILSALAIAQFVINQLSDATGFGDGNGDNLSCRDLKYVLENRDECESVFCREFPTLCSCEDKHFVVQSITPKTTNTQMNNAVIRVTFSRKLQNMSSNEIKNYLTILRNNVTSTEEFSFEVLGRELADANSLIQATYIGETKCEDSTSCLPAGTYQVIVSPNIKDIDGYNLELKTSCGDFSAEAEFTVTTSAVKDSLAPILTPLVVEMVNKSGVREEIADDRLPVGSAYYFGTSESDESGAGYVGLTLNNGSFENLGERIYGYFNGPASTSDAPIDNPYNFSQRVFFPENLIVPQRISLTLRGNDIDSKFAEVTSTYMLVGAHCKDRIKNGNETGTDVGGSCGGGDGASCHDDLDCAYSFKCIDPVGAGNVNDKICRPFPLIENVEPMDGGAGNWVTILGRNFGSTKGKVSFGIDKNQDGEVSAGDWLDVNLADCGEGTNVWHDQWVIIEVPADIDLDRNFLSDIKLESAKTLTIAGESIKPSDDTAGLTTPEWGVMPGPNDGWFLKNDAIRPGLCAITPGEAESKAQVVIQGKGLGDTQSGSTMKFGGVQAIIVGAGWSDAVVRSFVPVLSAGKVGVVATVNGENSNGVPFEILSDGSVKTPIISSIDPVTTTPGSLITIYGSNFGSSGHVYLAGNSNDAKACAINYDSTKCKELTTVGLPPQCSENWQDTQVIVNIPKNIDTKFIGGKTVYKIVTESADLADIIGLNLGNSINTLAEAKVYNDTNGDYSLLNDTAIEFDIELDNLTTSSDVGFIESGDLWMKYRFLFFRNDGKEQVYINEQVKNDGIVKRYLFIHSAVFLDKSMRDYGANVALLNNSTNLYNLKIEIKDNKMNVYLSEGGNPLPIIPKIQLGLDPDLIKKESLPFRIGNIISSLDDNSRLFYGKINKLEFIHSTQVAEKTLDEVNLILKNNFNLASSGENTFGLMVGEPQPGICAIAPASGPAPLPAGKFLNLYGINFSDTPTVKFWSPNTSGGWLENSEAINAVGFAYSKSIDGEKIQTIIPYENGLTMETGAIKVQDKNNRIGNSVNYLVNDCRDSNTAMPGFQCCSEGAEAGKWKLSTLSCKGQPDSAGYVWRFTTGLIPHLPEVMEVCDQVNWSKGTVTVPFPTPVPWQNWEGGTNACLNASIAVRFNMPMKNNFVGKVTVYKCAEAKNGDIDCSDKEEVEVNGPIYNNPVLYIHDGTTNLVSNTWYHVELKDNIFSAERRETLGNFVEFNQPLKKTKPCSDGTAYCFDFKTGDGNCTLASAGIIPDNYVTHLLGVVQDFSHPQDLVNPFNPHPPAQPYFYYVWGRGSQKCSVLNVDGYGWNWQTDNESWVSSTISRGGSDPSDNKLTPRYIDSRAKIIAWSNTTPWNVKITATTNTLQNVTDDNLTTITGTSTLVVDLSDPKVISYWPNCEEACINAGIGAQFNQMMVTSTFADGLEFYMCGDELCSEDKLDEQNDLISIDESMSSYNTLRINVSDPYLVKNSWYLVRLTSEIKAIGAFKANGSIQVGNDLQAFAWKFRTKNDDTPCKAEKVEVVPNNFTSFLIGEKTKYLSLPKTKPDSCSPYGQDLNPWSFGWEWTADVTEVATISNFSTGDPLNSFCSPVCKPLGSDKKLIEVPTYCGDGEVGAGEDCDIDDPDTEAGCGYNCLHTGNNLTTTTVGINLGLCGDGFVSTALGEECDPGDMDQKNYCKSNNCTWKGSASTQPAGQVTVSWCGSGSVTLGEECDTKDTATKKGCSSNCLHIGTALSQAWCDEQAADEQTAADVPQACNNAISICGNDIVESGEECEIIDDVAKKIKVHNEGDTLFTTIQPANKVCNSSCLLQNLCNEDYDEENLDVSDLKCDTNEQWCRPDCTLRGSSPNYTQPSLCGDGETGSGEYGFCEVSLSGENLGENPVQVATAVGEGEVDPATDDQYTPINAKAISFTNANGDKVGLQTAEQKTGTGKYYLQCGYKEFETQAEYGDFAGWYNNCPGDADGAQEVNTFGVGKNSCCYYRPVRNTVYPIDGAGFEEGSEGVCLNTYLEATFNNEIDKQTVLDNIVLLKGTTSSTYNCANNNTIDRTAWANELMGIDALEQDTKLLGFLNNIWQKIKLFFVSLFTNDQAVATTITPASVVWCEGSVGVQSKVRYEEITVGNETFVNTTTIAIYINNLLEKDTEYAVILKGGNSGIKDVRGVGIRAKDRENNDQLDDVWLFKTGKDVCKINKVTVSPEKAWYKKANTSEFFDSFAESENGQIIVSLPPAYGWTWHWAPANNRVFAIPDSDNPLDATSDSVDIASRQVEGSLIAVAQAKVTHDLSLTNNQVGKIFTGRTELTAKFCERPWPEPETEDSWLPLKDNKYNFSLSYCADAGRSGTTTDDLPFMNLLPVIEKDTGTNIVVVPGQCAQNPSTSCTTDASCPPIVTATPGKCVHSPSTSCTTSADCPDYSVAQPGACSLKSNNQSTVCNVDTDCPTTDWYVLPGESSLYVSCSKYGGAYNFQYYKDKSCKFRHLVTESKYCTITGQYPPDYASTYRFCTDATGCNAGENCVPFDPIWKISGVVNTCVGAAPASLVADTCSGVGTSSVADQCTGGGEQVEEIMNPTLTDDTLRRYLLFSNINDDVIGIQIFQNPDRLSAYDWYTSPQRFPNTQNAKRVELAGFDAVQDGDNYYINALNLVTTTGHDYALWNNIYQISLNKGAQANTKKVLEQILGSLEFNINISDHKYCLNDGTLFDNQDNINDQFSCNTDFECRETNGNIKTNTSGICSNAKTKFFRDLRRLNDIAGMQNKLASYFTSNLNKVTFEGNLPGGTFIPGATLSLWPSWNNTLGAKVGTLPQDPVNAWTSCTDAGLGAEKQTCWYAPSSTVYCPVFSNIYEYNYVSSTKSYLLHSPLEFFALSSNIVEEKINTSTFTTTPWCNSETPFRAFGEKCGDGIVAPGEECEPPGKNELTAQTKIGGVLTACAGATKAARTCTNTCTWSYGACQADFTCGNGEKESAEFCDEGQLNGTYGHCAGENSVGVVACMGPHQAYCGNFHNIVYSSIDSLIDKDANNKPLELCDFTSTTPLAQNKASIRTGNWVFQGNCSETSVNVNGGLISGLGNWLNYANQYNLDKLVDINTLQSHIINFDLGLEDPLKIQCNLSSFPGLDCDGDEIINDLDNCPKNANSVMSSSCPAGQPFCLPSEMQLKKSNGPDSDGDGLGNACDYYPNCAENDVDKDEKCGTEDNCPNNYNPLQNDIDGDGIGDACDEVSVILMQALQDLNDANKTGWAKERNDICTDKIGYCALNTNFVCRTNDDCNINTQSINIDEGLSGYSNVNDFLNDVKTTSEYKGRCVPIIASYAKNKEYSCSWDCQKYGSYCGDGVLDAGQEECDDGNDVDTDKCQNNCKLKATVFCGDGLVNGSETCDDGMQCENKKPCTTDNTCAGIGKGKCLPRNGDGCSISCALESGQENYCGNGIVDENLKEACDMGAQNGLECTPEYGKGKICTWCSGDCKKVFTKETTDYCGNGKIDVIVSSTTPVFEKCDVKSDGTVVSSTYNPTTKVVGEANKSCNVNDKGNFSCENNCLDLQNNCINCAEMDRVDGGANPMIAILNPMIEQGFNWDSIYGVELVSLYRNYPNVLGYLYYFKQIKLNINENGVPTNYAYFYKSSSLITVEDVLPKGIETNLQCKDEYKVFFNENGLQTKVSGGGTANDFWKNGYGDIFDYPVNDESLRIENDVIMSPAVPTSTVRIVVKWTSEEENKLGGFVGDVIKTNSPTEWTHNRLPTTTFGTIIKNADEYWVPDGCTSLVCVHAKVHTPKIYVQSFTVDAGAGKDYVFTVSALTNFIGGPAKRSNLQVEVYTAHANQIPAYSIYKPTRTFSIRNASGTSSNARAKYWYVFKIRGNNTAPIIAPVDVDHADGVIRTDECDVKVSADVLESCPTT